MLQLRALWALLACLAAVQARTDDFEFDDTPTEQSKGADRRYVYNPNSELCAALTCPRDQLCVLRARPAPAPAPGLAPAPAPAYAAALCAPREVAMSFRQVSWEAPAPAELLHNRLDDAAPDTPDEPDAPDMSPPAGSALAQQCMGCGERAASFVCGSDNRTYSSLCRLDLHNCLRRAAAGRGGEGSEAGEGEVRLACRGFCPCRKSNKNRRRNEAAGGSVGVEGSGSCAWSRLSSRLVSWFSALQAAAAAAAAAAAPPTHTRAGFPRGCGDEVRWMFHHLDTDRDRLLSDKELYALRHDDSERCLRPFLSRCLGRVGGGGVAGGVAGGAGGGVTRAAWCGCLRRAARPCAAARRDLRRTQPGGWEPACDAAGYYLPRQCGARGCWCVDRRGSPAPCAAPAPAAPPVPAPTTHTAPTDDEDAPGSGDGDY